ncbi:B12-binding domain-containing radical SAM protein [Streptomyces sp. NPDC056773]|uniref:B12-binding domain-containing radical SAM protein n=1 Tax=unclassified Streptomyces TaxID=2593676 RepID=UPI00367DDE4E
MPALPAQKEQPHPTALDRPGSPSPDPAPDPIAGAAPNRALDALFVNAPLRDYGLRPRTNDYTLPVLGMAYIATYAQQVGGFNVGVLDAEAHGLGIAETARLINRVRPRWVGMNLLAPTYEMSARIAAALDPGIALMVGGHHARAMPARVLDDPRMRNLRALVIGEGETRVAALLSDERRRAELPGVMWRDRLLGTHGTGIAHAGPTPASTAAHWLGPDIDALPLVDRTFLPQDPYLAEDGRTEANIVGSRGCPYDCGFCGAAVSANPDVKIRARSPEGIVAELDHLHAAHGTTAYRFVDDLFLGAKRVIVPQMEAFTRHGIGDRYVWDATGRINVFSRLDDAMYATLRANGLREVALGIESGSDRVLAGMDKRITAAMTEEVTGRLLAHGINVKGYFILGYPGETQEDLDATVQHIRNLWALADRRPGNGTFRASVFEFRPYPGTPVWNTLLKAGHRPDDLLAYADVDLTADGADESMRARDEFNFSVGIEFGGVPLPRLRTTLAMLTREQYTRNRTGIPA